MATKRVPLQLGQLNLGDNASIGMTMPNDMIHRAISPRYWEPQYQGEKSKLRRVGRLITFAASGFRVSRAFLRVSFLMGLLEQLGMSWATGFMSNERTRI